MRHGTTPYAKFDWWTFLTWFALVVIGLVAIYSTTHTEAREFLLLSVQQNFQRQLTWMVICIVVIGVTLLLPVRFFQTMAYPIYAFTILLVVAALVFGREINGAKSWVAIGPLSLQSSELAKVGAVLAIAQLFAAREAFTHLVRRAVAAVGILLVPAVLIIMQNDTGTALVFLGLIPVILFWIGIPISVVSLLVTPAVVGYLAIVYLPAAVVFTALVVVVMFFATRNWTLTGLSLAFNGGTFAAVTLALTKFLQPHQLARIASFVNPEAYRLESGFHIIQARAAIGSGGLTGKGFLQGTQTQMAFVPEQSTDFIFTVIGEEWGFLGSVVLLLLFGFLLIRITLIGQRIKHPFATLFAAGVTGIFFFHILINISMTVGLMPVIGIPLPFVSYGGSALLANTALIAIMLNLYMRRDDFPRLTLRSL